MHKIPEACFSSTLNKAQISHHHYKKRLKISKTAQFESNLLKPNKKIQLRKDERFYTRLYGGEHTTETL